MVRGQICEDKTDRSTVHLNKVFAIGLNVLWSILCCCRRGRGICTPVGFTSNLCAPKRAFSRPWSNCQILAADHILCSAPTVCSQSKKSTYQHGASSICILRHQC